MDRYTTQDVQRSLEDAGKAMVICHVTGVWPAGYQGFWPDIVRESMSGDYAVGQRVQFKTNLHQMSELEKVEGWIADLSQYCRDKQTPWVSRAVTYRMMISPHDGQYVWPYRKLGRKVFSGASHTTVRGWYNDGVAIITRQRNILFEEGRKNK